MRGGSVAVLVVWGVVGLGAQNVKPTFGVASVRASQPNTQGAMNVTDARVDIRKMPLLSIVLFAFKVEAFQLVTPEWVKERERVFDIQATFPTGATREQAREMMQTLLAERFGMVSHVESRPLDVYELTVDGGGMKMRAVEPVDELAKAFTDPSGRPNIADFVSGAGDDQQRTIMSGSRGVRVVTSRTNYERINTERRTTVLDATRMTIAELVGVLRNHVDRPVIDKTGLGGIYQFKVEL